MEESAVERGRSVHPALFFVLYFSFGASGGFLAGAAQNLYVTGYSAFRIFEETQRICERHFTMPVMMAVGFAVGGYVRELCLGDVLEAIL